ASTGAACSATCARWHAASSRRRLDRSGTPSWTSSPGPPVARRTGRGCGGCWRAPGEDGNRRRSRTLARVEAPDPRTPVVVAARRSAVTTAGRALAGSDAAALASPVLAALRDDLSGADLALLTTGVDDVLLGNCCGPGVDVGRVAALAAGLGDSAPGVTVDP